MIEITGFKINNTIYDSNNTTIYKALWEKDNTPVILKLLKNNYPNPEEIKKFKYEFEVVKNISDINGIMKNFDMIQHKNTYAIIMEDINGVSLDKIIQSSKINLKTFLYIAIRLTEILGEIHKKNIIHKDLKPHNVIINLENNEVKLIDFSISTKLSRETQSLVNPGVLEGTLAYISPEQTGRMNRTIDYRSDYYSLGVMLYEMTTGKRPFDSDDPMELVHCHIAVIPQAPNEVDNNIPKVVSDIIMKLLSKNAEDRYQSTSGILYDLKKCFKQIQEKGSITDNFKIAGHDVSDRFQIPEKLYGREKEIELLLNKFNEVSIGSKEIMFFSGPSGIGKSVLISEVHKPIVAKRGYFIEGKFDQFKRNIPYTAISQAFTSIAKQILTESEERISEWKDKILNVVGSIGRVITDVIPMFELVIGKQPEVQELPANESQNRFNMLFQNFIKIFATAAHPLVLFIDDLQWADQGSMFLLEKLVEDNELKYFLFLGSYRDNEIDPSHYLNNLIKKIKDNKELSAEYIKVMPLKVDDVIKLISETINTDANQIKELSELIHIKTSGNPFFICELLKKLYNDELIYFNNGWKWDYKKIKEAGLTENIVELMSEKIKKLPDETLNVLKTASCIGVKFYLDFLSKIYGKDIDTTFNDIIPASNEGMIIKSDHDVNFVHDRVREAAYNLLTEKEKAKMHYRIGKMMLESSTNIDDNIFNIVNQLNLAKSLLNEEEKKELINLNYQAGKKAKASAAFDAALNFYREGMELLSDDSWNEDYELTLKLNIERAEAEYLCTNFEEAENYFNIILGKAKTEFEKLKIYELKIKILASQLKLNEAIDYGIKIIKKFGINLPKKPNELSALPDIIKSKLKLGKRSPEELISKQNLTNKNIIAAIHLMVTLCPYAYQCRSNLIPVIVLKLVNLSMKYGNSAAAAYGYSGFGLIQAGVLGNAKIGYKFGQLAFKVLEKYNDKYFESQVSYIVGGFINHWAEHANKSIIILENGYKSGLFNGDLPYFGFNADDLYNLKIIVGENLKKVSDELTKLYPNILKTNEQSAIYYIQIYGEMILNLIGESSNKIELNGKYFNEKVIIHKLINDVTKLAYYHAKIILSFIFDDYSGGLKLCNTAMPYIGKAFGKFQVPEINFYYCLFIAKNTKKSKIKKNIKKINIINKKIEKWSKDAPENHLHKFYLIKAEVSRLNNNDKEAMNLYDKAITSAKVNGYVNIEAIANECASKFYQTIGLNKIAEVYMKEAHYCYIKWGALAKVKQLEEKYPYLLEENIKQKSHEDISSDKTISAVTLSTGSKTKSSTGRSFLDIETIMKASQTISSEIEMKNLLNKLIKIVIENGGAQKGLLILKDNNDNLLIEAYNEVGKSAEVLQSIPIDKSNKLSPAIVRFVAKTMENIVLNDACNVGEFTSDAYIQSNKPKSVLCSPIIKQGKLLGLLYLENNLTTGAFTQNHLEVLSMLSSQIAISIENSRLINNLKEQERLKKEMEIAERIQTSLCPPAPEHPEFEITAVMQPAEEVGGDYYDIIIDKNSNLWFVIGDVSGHGVTPGLIMMMAQTSINSYIKQKAIVSPKDIYISTNDILCENIKQRLKESHFMTLSLLKYEGKGLFKHAGTHLDIIVYRNKTKKCELIKTDGLYLGMKPDLASVTKEMEFKMDKDDIMVLYTDGITESRDEEGTLFDVKRLTDIVEKNADKTINNIKEIIINNSLDWCKNKQADDMTMIIAKKK